MLQTVSLLALHALPQITADLVSASTAAAEAVWNGEMGLTPQLTGYTVTPREITSDDGVVTIDLDSRPTVIEVTEDITSWIFNLPATGCSSTDVFLYYDGASSREIAIPDTWATANRVPLPVSTTADVYYWLQIAVVPGPGGTRSVGASLQAFGVPVTTP